MNNERASRVWTAIAMRAHRDGASMSARHACLACVEALALSGAGLALTTKMNGLEPEYSTDSRSDEVEELQATVGQGPGMDALASGQSVLVEDLTAPAYARRWPMFTPEACRLGVRSISSLPLALGAIRVGVLDLYNDTPHQLDPDQLVEALVYADTALLLTLDARSGIETSANGDRPDKHAPTLWHSEVHQAAGMVSVQLAIPVLDALVRLRAHAYGHDQRLTDVARAVVERRLRLPPDSAQPATDHGKDSRS
ncbi:MAG: GAF and ANTAR domain-containing protein [Mycobacterium sp.]|nr:GAF and ANTAR domain-containing protein [Mycobacterium sp.]